MYVELESGMKKFFHKEIKHVVLVFTIYTIFDNKIKYIVMKALNIDNFYLKLLFLLSIISFVFSCRQIPEDEKMYNENISLG